MLQAAARSLRAAPSLSGPPDGEPADTIPVRKMAMRRGESRSGNMTGGHRMELSGLLSASGLGLGTLGTAAALAGGQTDGEVLLTVLGAGLLSVGSGWWLSDARMPAIRSPSAETRPDLLRRGD